MTSQLTGQQSRFGLQNSPVRVFCACSRAEWGVLFAGCNSVGVCNWLKCWSEIQNNATRYTVHVSRPLRPVVCCLFRANDRKHPICGINQAAVACGEYCPKIIPWAGALYFNPLTPNDPYSGRTAPLTSGRCILYIYSTNICTEYFKHGIYSPFFLFKMQFVSSF